jgi:hypothetical protein
MKFYPTGVISFETSDSVYAEEVIHDITFKLLEKIQEYRTEDGKDISGYPPELLE